RTGDPPLGLAALERADPVRVLVVNAGSSSLKLRVLDDSDQVTGTADLPAPRGAADAGAVESTLASLGETDAIGHRIVHGGTLFTAPVLIDDAVLAKLRGLTDLAPRISRNRWRRKRSS